MTMKQLFRHTTFLLRTVLLLGAIAFVNTQQTQAQPVSITAEMPDAFETKTPVIGDGEYYYVQFYYEEVYSPYLYQPFLGELGEGVQMQAMDYMPFAPNRLWTLVAGSDATHFKLMSKRGYFAYYANNRFYTTSNEDNASEFTITDRNGYRKGFKELITTGNNRLGRWEAGGEWGQIIDTKGYNNVNFVRFAKLKPNAAHIIYYRGEGVDNNDPQASTTRHYLTYSGTDNNHTEWNFRPSTVSSRRSIIPSDKSLWTLPTAAVYHQDGLWDLEEANSDGEFFIKRHGTDSYLNPTRIQEGDWFDCFSLEEKNSVSGKYALDEPAAKRYSRVKNVRLVTDDLTNAMFFNWNGYGADATKSSDTPAQVDWNVGNGTTFTEGLQTVVGTGWVDCQRYADLSDYESMTISGTPGLQLRVYLSRQESNDGPFALKNVTIGNNGSAAVDLSNLELNTPTTGWATVKMTHVNGSDGTDSNTNKLFVESSYGEETYAIAGYNTVGTEVGLGEKSWNVNNIIYLNVDASAIPGRISKVTLRGKVSSADNHKRNTIWGAGYNDMAWSSDMTWNSVEAAGGFSITDLTPTRVEVDKNLDNEPIELDITEAFINDPDKIATILVYELAAGGGWFSDTSVEVEYYPTVSFAHLNAIKTGYGGLPGSVNSITLTKKSNAGHLHHAEGDGWPAMLYGDENAQGYWYAGFYPVEVPVSQKDEFFQVRVRLNPPYGPQEDKQYIYLNPKQNSGITRKDLLTDGDNIVGAIYKASDDWQNCFQYNNNAGGDNRITVPSGYHKLVVRFASPVDGNWGISGIVPNGSGGWKQGWEQIPVGSLYYEMDLTAQIDGQAITQINDFTIFSMTNSNYDDPNHPVKIEIAEIYYYRGTMLNNAKGGSMSGSEGFPSLWELEQIEDYAHFRLKNPDTGKYLAGNPHMTEPNDPNGEAYEGARKAEVHTNSKFWTDFSLTWYIPTENAEKEIRVNHYVRHTESYLRKYSAAITNQEEIRRQGLATNVDSEWWNFDGNGFEDQYDIKKGTQKTNHFEITHYVKKGSSRVIEFPTVLNKNNDHIFFQRFYHYGEKDTEMDLDNLKAHVSLDTRDDGDVQYFLYNNGMVTGQKLDWRTYDSGTQTYTAIPDGGMSRNEQRRFNFTNSDGTNFNVAVDVSRYSDLKYLNNPDHLAGDLREPSLTMRYIFKMYDAKDMAKKLTAYTEDSGEWLEQKEVHFGRTQVPYTKFKKVGYRGEFLGIRHIFSDYWVYNDPQLANDDYLATLRQTMTEDAINELLENNLVCAATDNNSGKIEVVLEPGNTGIRRGGYNSTLDLNSETYDDSADDESRYQGFYFYDKLSPSPKTQYGNSRFVVFRYPASGIVSNCGPENPAYLKVYLNNNGTRYQIAKFTLIFDANMATRPWTKVKNGTHYANGIDCVKGTSRDPNNLRASAGHPIAKVSFDFPKNTTYKFPTSGDCPHTDGVTKHDGGNFAAGGEIANSSPIPLTFGHTNYSFDGNGCNWGSYALVTEKMTTWGNDKIVKPADDDDYGYGIPADDGMQKAFMYIDASEQPGDICAVDFEGEFCANDKLMCSGWISGSNRMRGDTRCPGSITLTVKGEDEFGNSQTIYRFCPGQIYELDDGYGHEGYVQGETPDTSTEVGSGGVDGGTGSHVVWQQFYFEFSTTQKYGRYWLEVNNNCVSSNGGDFMLDNVEIYTIVPEVEPEINTPLCVKLDEDGHTVTEMRLLKLKINFNKLISSRSDLDTDGTDEEGFVFLEKYKFLEKFRTELKHWSDHLTAAQKATYGITGYDFENMPLDTLAAYIEKGKLKELPTDNESAYKKAFDHAILGNTTTWHSDRPGENMNSSIMYFRWNSNYNAMEEYTFAKAVNKTKSVYRETDKNGERWVVMNGNYPELNWKTDIDYYIINTSTVIVQGTTDEHGHYHPVNPCDAFNLLSECAKATTFRIDPPYHVLGLESSESTTDHVVCEGQIPTISLELKGFDLKGNEVDMKGLNYDWWLGHKGDDPAAGIHGRGPTVLATLEEYHKQKKNIDGQEVKLDEALATLRAYYPAITSLNGIVPQTDANPYLTNGMIKYLQSLVDAGELVLHQTTVSVPAEKASDDDPYFYVVACPIHDEAFGQALNPADDEYVAYFCDEPQGLRIKVGQKAPTLKSGFVPNEHGFTSYDYTFPEGTDPVLSIRLAKAAQFETVKNTAAEATDGSLNYDVNHLWLPIRNARTQTASGVIQKSRDENIYLASSNDPTWDKKISQSMNKNGLLPIVGRIVKLEAINTKDNSEGAAADATVNINEQNTYNRLRVYFTENFEVREGYNYTLSLPFQERPNASGDDVNPCDGTLLINLKIVPDYEVWTGGAGNTDWNNDENWRRADGNSANSGLNQDELYVGKAATTSPLYEYKTNEWNYRTPKDRVFRKGFAPLYCTHILMKSDEWGNAPELYDAIDGNAKNATTNSQLVNSPFPNLRDTSTPILKFDMQARSYNMWNETYGEAPDRGESSRPNDLIAEMYQVNSCDEIAFQPGTELLNAHLLNYNSAWVEYQLDNKRWYLLGSPLQGTISGEWYAPSGTAKQETTYYDAVTFGDGYDRYSPAIYQRSWDKAKAVLYEIGSAYSATDDSQTQNLGSANEGIWNGSTWNTAGADEYLDRLGYKAMGGNKANVAIQGIWSNTYNDAQVDYANGGFSVMVMNHLKNNDSSYGKSIIRLPKEDTMYDYYKFSEDGSDDGGTDTNLSDVRGKNRAKNRGRLKTDLLLPASVQKTESAASVYGDQRTYTRIPIKESELNTMLSGIRNHTEAVPVGASNLGYYLVENPFPCGLDMDKFFAANTGLETKYWLLTKTGQHLVQKAAEMTPSEWISPTISTADGDLFAAAEAVVAPGQGFFVQAKTAGDDPTVTINFNSDMQAQSRYGVESGSRTFTVVVGQVQEMEQLVENGEPVYIDVDLNGNGVYGETGVLVDGNTVDEKEPVMVPKYEKNGDTYVLDSEGNKIPVLKDVEEDVVLYNYVQDAGNAFPLKAPTRGVEESNLAGLVITAQRGDSQSSALVMQRSEASNDFLPSEDTETFITSDLKDVPTVYTLCGRLATTINSIRDFRSLPLGVESTSDAPCTLTFNGVELLGDSIAFYDAVEQKLTPLESGMQIAVSGQTQNRYYLVSTLIQEKAAEETHLQIFTNGLTVKVIASTAEPILNVRCYDTGGHLMHKANPQSPEYSFNLSKAGVYIIEAETENDRKIKKVIVR